MRSEDATKRNVMLSNKEALHEILVAALTLSMQIEEVEAAEHILDALRALHDDDDSTREGALDAGVH
jgi:hypothetical protein